MLMQQANIPSKMNWFRVIVESLPGTAAYTHGGKLDDSLDASVGDPCGPAREVDLSSAIRLDAGNVISPVATHVFAHIRKSVCGHSCDTSKPRPLPQAR